MAIPGYALIGEKRMRRYFFNQHEWFLVIVLVVLSACITWVNPSFLTFENITDLLKSFTVLGMFSLGMFMVIVSGGFDISFTAIAQATQYAVVAMLMFWWPAIGNIYLALAMAIFFGLILGCINGAIIHVFKITMGCYNAALEILYLFPIFHVFFQTRDVFFFQ